MGRRGLALFLVLLATSASAQAPVYIQTTQQFAPYLCPSALQSVRLNSGGTQWECFTPASSTSDITGVGNCAAGDAFTGSCGNILTSTTGETINLATANTFIFARDDAGDVTFMGADNSSPANTIYDTTGAGAITVGSADVTSVTVTTDGTGTAEFVVPNDSITLGTETDGNYAGSASEGGPATTALALDANGTNCLAGSAARGVDASGNAENCYVTGTMSSFTIDNDDAGSVSVVDGDTIVLAGGDGIVTQDSGDTITVSTISDERDFLDETTGALGCGASTEGMLTIVNGGPGIQFCDDDATPDQHYLAFGDSNGRATAVSGGTGIDTSGSTGIPKVVAGTWSIVDGTAANLGDALTSETGTSGLVFKDSPTFTTQITSPLIYGGTAADGDLQLGSTTNADKGSIVISPGFANAPDVSQLVAFDASFDMTAASSALYGLGIGAKGAGARGTWTVDTNLSGAGAGGLLFVFNPIITNDPGVAISDMGDWSTLVSRATFNGDGNGGATAVTLPLVTMIDNAHTFDGINSGTITVTAYRGMTDAPTIASGATVAQRIVVLHENRSGAGTQTESYGLFTSDQTVGSFATSIYSGMNASGSAKFNIYADGTAPSVHAGPITAGGTAVATTGYDLEVDGDANVDAGSSTDIAGVGGALGYSTTQVCNNGTGEDTLMSYTVPASALGVAGDQIHFRMAGTIKNDADTKQLKVKFGTTTLLDTGAAMGGAAYDWVVEGWCARVGLSSQKCAVALHTSTAGTSWVDYTAPTETLSGALALSMTATVSAGTDVNDACQEMLEVEWLPSNT